MSSDTPKKSKPRVVAPPQTMLVPIAYSESVMPTLRLARSSRTIYRLARFLCVALLFSIVLMAFAPWQQTVTGSGTVIAYAPRARQQVIEAPIKGRIVRWADGIAENARVTKGQFIVEIQDLDASYSARLQEQVENSQQAVEAMRAQLDAKERALAAAKMVVESYENQLRAYLTVKDEIVAAQDAYVEMAEKKVLAEQQLLSEYRAALPQLQAEYDRMKSLHEGDNIALQKLQEVERKLAEAQAKIRRAEAYVDSAKAELVGKQRDRNAKQQKAQIDIDYATAGLRKVKVDVPKAESEVAKATQELSKADKELVDARVKMSRQKSQIVHAPFDGFIVQITPNLGTRIVKESDPLCTIVPDSADRAVQIWLDGNDAPLVEPGRHVRLQFEGWPALQFAGWPSVAVGTFGGEIVSVDATDNGRGRFRALIRPDALDAPWPSERFLRQGVRSNGWVLLEQVPLWFEVWRQLNSFPPVVDTTTRKVAKDTASGSKSYK